MQQLMTLPALQSLLRSAATAEALSTVGGNAAGCVLVDLDEGALDPAVALVQPGCTVIGLRRQPSTPVPQVVDVVVSGAAQLELITRAVAGNPHAACLLMQVLRHNEGASVADGLLAESLAYATLQHGAEFACWLAARARRTAQPEPARQDLVLLERSQQRLTVTLNRAHKRNAYSAELRDALCDALQLPLEDPSIDAVVLRGAGRAFCAGGDLEEFGAARDAAVAHLTRTTRSAAVLLHRLRARLGDRLQCRLHGACIGAGIELPAFAGRVIAADDAFFQLPEVAMGLIPGAGGTVSILRRVGRLRTAYLALSNQPIDAPTALAWGLVDELAAA